MRPGNHLHRSQTGIGSHRIQQQEPRKKSELKQPSKPLAGARALSQAKSKVSGQRTQGKRFPALTNSHIRPKKSKVRFMVPIDTAKQITKLQADIQNFSKSELKAVVKELAHQLSDIKGLREEIADLPNLTAENSFAFKDGKPDPNQPTKLFALKVGHPLSRLGKFEKQIDTAHRILADAGRQPANIDKATLLDTLTLLKQMKEGIDQKSFSKSQARKDIKKADKLVRHHLQSAGLIQNGPVKKEFTQTMKKFKKMVPDYLNKNSFQLSTVADLNKHLEMRDMITRLKKSPAQQMFKDPVIQNIVDTNTKALSFLQRFNSQESFFYAPTPAGWEKTQKPA